MQLLKILCCLSLLYKCVYGHRVIGFLHYAEDACAHVQPSWTEDSTNDFVKCKYEFLGILTRDENLNEVNQMAFTLGYIFGESNYKTGLKLASKIHTKCGKTLVPLKTKLATEGKPFFECVSRIIKIEIDPETKIALQGRIKEKDSDIELQPDDVIYPNLTCHRNYNSDSSNPEVGEGLIIATFKFCKYVKNPTQNSRPEYIECLKTCMADMLGILDPNSYGYTKVRWNPYRDMINYMRLLIKNKASAIAIVNKILITCGTKIALVTNERRYPCHTSYWKEFFQCIDSVWDCNSMVKGKAD